MVPQLLARCGVSALACAAFAASGQNHAQLGQAARQVSGQVHEGPFVATSATAQDPGEVEFPSYKGAAPLRKVRLTMRHHISYAFRVENQEPTQWWGATQSYPSLYSFPWFRTEAGGVIQSGVPSWTISLCWLPPLGPYDGVLDYAGAAGAQRTVLWDMCAQPAYWTTTTQEIDQAWALAPFTDADGVVQLAIQPMTWLQQDIPYAVPAEGSLAGGVDWFQWDVIVDRVEYFDG